MDWLSLPVPVMLGPDFLRKPEKARSAWLSLLAHCALRENGGVIADAKSWSNRDWDRCAGTTSRGITRVVDAELAWWEGPDLHVAHYPLGPEEVQRRRRDGGRVGGERSAEARKSLKTPPSTPSKDADGELRSTPSNGEERRGEERRGEESVEDRARGTQDARDLAAYLADAIRSHSPGARVNVDAWTVDIDLAIRRDHRKPVDLRRAIDWAHRSADSFWQPNLRSGLKLREHFETLIGQANRAGFQTLAIVRRPPASAPGPGQRMTEGEMRALERNARELGLVDDQGNPL